MPIRHIAFLTPGNYPAGDPLAGLEETLRLFEHAEAIGFDSGWVRSRHLERGIASAATFLAAASQRTSRIRLGTGVVQLGYENPFRLAEDFATVDVLSRGRLEVGVSAGPPGLASHLGDLFVEGDPTALDHSHARAERLRRALRSDLLGDEAALVHSPAGDQRPRLHPVAPGLADRLWYGGGSLRSAEWAGRNGFHLLVGNLNRGEDTDDFATAQTRQLDLFLAGWSRPEAPRIALGRVIVPLDGAGRAARERHLAFLAGRTARTTAPQGPSRTLFSPDLVGSADEILEALSHDRVLPLVSELRLELPYDLPGEEYRRILSVFADEIAPELGWTPATPRAAASGDERPISRRTAPNRKELIA